MFNTLILIKFLIFFSQLRDELIILFILLYLGFQEKVLINFFGFATRYSLSNNLCPITVGILFLFIEFILLIIIKITRIMLSKNFTKCKIFKEKI